MLVSTENDITRPHDILMVMKSKNTAISLFTIHWKKNHQFQLPHIFKVIKSSMSHSIILNWFKNWVFSSVQYNLSWIDSWSYFDLTNKLWSFFTMLHCYFTFQMAIRIVHEHLYSPQCFAVSTRSRKQQLRFLHSIEHAVWGVLILLIVQQNADINGVAGKRKQCHLLTWSGN